MLKSPVSYDQLTKLRQSYDQQFPVIKFTTSTEHKQNRSPHCRMPPAEINNSVYTGCVQNTDNGFPFMSVFRDFPEPFNRIDFEQVGAGRIEEASAIALRIGKEIVKRIRTHLQSYDGGPMLRTSGRQFVS